MKDDELGNGSRSKWVPHLGDGIASVVENGAAGRRDAGQDGQHVDGFAVGVGDGQVDDPLQGVTAGLDPTVAAAGVAVDVDVLGRRTVDGVDDALHGADARHRHVVQHRQVVLFGELEAHLAPLAQEAALGEEQDPSAPERQIHPVQVLRQVLQRLFATLFALVRLENMRNVKLLIRLRPLYAHSQSLLKRTKYTRNSFQRSFFFRGEAKLVSDGCSFKSYFFG